MSEYPIEKAHLYALNAFLTEHYIPGYLHALASHAGSEAALPNRQFRMPGQVASGSIFASDCYGLESVVEEGNISQFGIIREKRETLFKSNNYYVLFFTHRNNEIKVQKGQKDIFDKMLIEDVYSVLSNQPYSKLIPNLDDLLPMEECKEGSKED